MKMKNSGFNVRYFGGFMHYRFIRGVIFVRYFTVALLVLTGKPPMELIYCFRLFILFASKSLSGNNQKNDRIKSCGKFRQL